MKNLSVEKLKRLELVSLIFFTIAGSMFLFSFVVLVYSYSTTPWLVLSAFIQFFAVSTILWSTTNSEYRIRLMLKNTPAEKGGHVSTETGDAHESTD